MKSKTTIIVWSLASIVLVVALWIYPDAPSQIPIHWGIDNEVNGYGPKFTLLLYPLFIVGFDLAIQLTRKIDPKKENIRKFSSSYDTFRLFIALFIMLVEGVSILEMLRPGSMNIALLVTLLVGWMITLIGNMMPRFRQNYFFGIKTPWTLHDETIWRKTHRLSGRLWFGGGLLICASAFLPGELNFYVMIFITSLLVIIPLVYSYVVYRNHEKKETNI